ncbi:MAG: hypothetical protein LBH55_00870 [Mycoplasmataceae bacterium]|jgi:tetrahydromethanopterin S-methyltransferase subunit G|nr:hypothetical protein [Mycoplasmataceae bacterium]
MKRFFGRVAKFVITRISGKPIKEGTEMTVQFEKVGEGVTGHKKPKKHHRRNKQPVWFKEFVDNVFLPTIARIEVRLDAIEKRLDAVEKRLDAVERRLDAVESKLERNNIV